jgi:hypothetical protein
VLSKLVLGVMLFWSCQAVAADGCKRAKGTKVCHVVKEKKVAEDVTYLDMSQLEGKVDAMPAITPKGKL